MNNLLCIHVEGQKLQPWNMNYNRKLGLVHVSILTHLKMYHICGINSDIITQVQGKAWSIRV
jgi:hypothetical protein